MFEDSTFESTGRIRTRSRGWMMATFSLNGSILVALILIPLIYPEALPHQVMSILLTAPPPPPQPVPQQPKPLQQFHGVPQMDAGTLVAPRLIPTTITHMADREEPAGPSFLALDGPSGSSLPADSVFRSQRLSVAPAEKKGPVRISSSVVAGLVLHKTIPAYPAIAVATRTEGTVKLGATISKTGTIEDLHVISGPALLQQAAIDAVSNWRYRPFLLNGEPVEVETTVNVIFTLGH